MTRPKTKDAVNFLVKAASGFLNDRRVTDVNMFMLFFTPEYTKIGLRYPTRQLGRMTYIVPDQVSKTHEKILEIVRIYFTDISELDPIQDRKAIVEHRGTAKKALDELRM